MKLPAARRGATCSAKVATSATKVKSERLSSALASRSEAEIPSAGLKSMERQVKFLLSKKEVINLEV